MSNKLLFETINTYLKNEIANSFTYSSDRSVLHLLNGTKAEVTIKRIA